MSEKKKYIRMNNKLNMTVMQKHLIRDLLKCSCYSEKTT